ncbi:hypothetical protein FEM48_Zijuj11G0166400 [Ziziphus jujuba var. spinosa]|uniref:Uncharacterized protein n=1 Tax=Ziziphus jujuba var. spinosa TaxID=714518 RepID=A0A978UK27_ZIZJJ|nr:hypothetical protein FEM48_Zijuj11G0166400 [Ziziphus jujuba var. spinosa]
MGSSVSVNVDIHFQVDENCSSELPKDIEDSIAIHDIMTAEKANGPAVAYRIPGFSWHWCFMFGVRNL